MKSNDQKAGQASEKLLEINKVLLKLDSSIRSQAFEILRPLYFDTKPAQNSEDEIAVGGGDEFDVTEFFKKGKGTKPSDNVLHIVAWLYSQHGNIIFTKILLKEEGGKHDLILPDRPDMTMRQMKHKGKAIFKKSGSGYRLTTHGQTYCSRVYGVKAGKKPLEPKEVE
jgi:hypothetical protein